MLKKEIWIMGNIQGAMNLVGAMNRMIGVMNLFLVCIWFLYLYHQIGQLKKRIESLEKEAGDNR